MFFTLHKALSDLLFFVWWGAPNVKKQKISPRPAINSMLDTLEIRTFLIKSHLLMFNLVYKYQTKSL